MQPEWIVTAALGFLTIAQGTYSVLTARRKANAESAASQVETSLLLIDPLRDALAAGRAKEKESAIREGLLLKELALQERWRAALWAQLIDAGIDPITLDEITRLENND